MHEQIRRQNHFTNPCLQIMFNINSKSVINNNITSEKQKQSNLNIQSDLLPQKIDQPFIFSNKKNINQSSNKIHKNIPNKTNISTLKPQDSSSQQNCKSKKKNVKINKNNLSLLEIKKSKSSGVKNNVSQGFSKLHLYEEASLGSGKKLTKPNSKLKSSKQMRQKVIELIIQDYEKGRISAQNFKAVITSLIEKQSQLKGSNIKSKGNSYKNKTQYPNSYRSSVANSLRNTPKNIPTKSKSQKFYQYGFRGIKFQNVHQFKEQPQIVERVIDRKDFVNKIIIKGINTSLFLSNQWTDSDSPPKESLVNINCIYTSDSVKDLRKEMQKITTKNIFVQESNKTKAIFNSVQSKSDSQRSSNQFNEGQTKSILAYYLDGLKNDENNQLSFNGSSFSMQKYKSEKSQNQFQLKKVDKYQKLITQKYKKNQQQQSLEQLCVRNDINSKGQDYSKLQQLQNLQVQFLSDNQIQSQNSSSNYNQREGLPFLPQIEWKLKSYLSSELQNKSRNIFNLSFTKNQQLNQKIIKNTTQSQVNKLNQILDVITKQLNLASTQQTTINEDEILSKIVSFMQIQKIKAEQELKIYNSFKQKSVSSDNKVQNNQIIEQNQIINSFRKKFKNKNLVQNQQKPLQYSLNTQIHYQSHQNNLNSSQNSIGSLSSSNHLEKAKISQLNLDQIQIGLRKRFNDIELKREQQISKIKQKFINNTISPKQYQKEKEIIEKWFIIESIKLKKTKRNLAEGYKRAKQYLLKDQISYQTLLTREKSNKMIKCISEKYLAQFILKNQTNSLGQNNKSKIHVPASNNDKQSRFQGKKTSLIEGKYSYETQEQQFMDFVLSQGLKISPISQQLIGRIENQTKESNQIIYRQNELKFSNQNQNQDKNYFSDCRKQQISELQVQLIQPSIDQFRSEISDFLEKYENENFPSEQLEDSGDQNCQNSAEQQIETQQIDYENYSVEDDWKYEDEISQNEIEIIEQDSKDLNFKIQQQQKTKQFSASEQALYTKQPSQLNIIINKRLPPSQDELFSPKKPNLHEQFSQQLQEYSTLEHDSQKISLSFISLNTQINKNHLKLKYLNDQDKDDIFQFMFLDLCLQIFLEQSKNNRIMKSIEQHIAQLRKKKKIPKGFKTGLEHCKTYIVGIQSYLESKFFNYLNRLQFPMGPSAKQMLKFMRQYDQLSETDSENETVNLVLPIQIYQKFEIQSVNQLQVERYYDDNDRQEGRLKFLNSVKHFHNKALFDSLNQMLDIQRNYGIWGKPFPWKKALNIDRQLNDLQLKQKLKKSSQKVIENCSYLCGVLVDKEDCVFGKSSISEEYLHHIREDRMSKMLSNDMLDNQDRWIFYDDEETQVLVSISKSISAMLFIEVVNQIKLLYRDDAFL